MALKKDEERRVGVDDLECQLAWHPQRVEHSTRRGANHHFPQHTVKLRFLVSLTVSLLTLDQTRRWHLRSRWDSLDTSPWLPLNLRKSFQAGYRVQ
jgi:hypothetical protein